MEKVGCISPHTHVKEDICSNLTLAIKTYNIFKSTRKSGANCQRRCKYVSVFAIKEFVGTAWKKTSSLYLKNVIFNMCLRK